MSCPPTIPAPPAANAAYRWRLAAAPLVLLAAGVVYYRVDPNHTSLWPCVFNRVTHLYCPGCGGQRALHELLHGNWITALHDNALFIVLLPILAWEFLAWTTGRFRPVLPRHPVGWTVCYLVIVFFVVRNLPWWPCSLLKP